MSDDCNCEQALQLKGKLEAARLLMRMLTAETEEIVLCFEHYTKEEGDMANLAEAQSRSERLLSAFTDTYKTLWGEDSD